MRSRLRDRFSVGWALLLLELAASRSLRAQALRGQVRGQQDEQPVAGALVYLLDSAGRPTDRTFTDEAGRFLVRATGPAEYSLLVLRIGYQKWQSPALRLANRDTLDYRAYVPESPVQLPALSIETRRQCRSAPQAGATIAAMWEEARKALELTELTRRQNLFRFRIVRSTRRLDQALVPVEDEEVDTTTLTTYQPFTSLAPESLVAAGFVRDSEGVAIYYGPDAPVLFSDAFLGHHCFRGMVPGPAESSLVGLAFEPIRGIGLPDIRGVLWLDRKTAALRHLEFHYTNVEPELGDQAGGYIEFLRLPTGAWIIRRWWIQAPIRVRGVRRSADRPHPAGYRVRERRVLEVLTTDGRRVLQLPEEP